MTGVQTCALPIYPQGIYYGGTIAAPVVKSVFENILPYLGIEREEIEEDKEGEDQN